MARYEDLLDEEPLAPRKRGWRSFIWRHLLAVTTSLLVALLMIVVLWPYVVITVPSGRVGVYWKRINNFDFYCWCFSRGTILDPRELREEGLHFIWPWDKLFIYDLRLQSTTQTINAISKDGVNVTAQMNVRYQLAHRAVAVLHKFIGPQYLETVINPEVGSVAREVISKYTAEEVYTSRDAIQSQVRAGTQKSLGANLDKLVQPEATEQPDPKGYNDFLQGSIQILDILVLSIELPLGDRQRHQSADRAVLHDPGIQIPGRERSPGVETQTDRGQRHSRLPADGQQGHFGFLPALARH